MEKLVKKLNEFVVEEHELFIGKNHRGYFVTDQSIAPISGRRATHSPKKYNEITIRPHVDAYSSTSYKEGVRKLVSLTDVLSGTSSVKAVAYGQQKIDFFPWIGPTLGQFRIITKQDGDNAYIILRAVYAEGKMSPVRDIKFLLKSAIIDGSPRWLLETIEFYPDEEIGRNTWYPIDILASNGSTIVRMTRDGDMAYVNYANKTDKERAIVVTHQGYVGMLQSHDQNDAVGQFMDVVTQRINAVTQPVGVNPFDHDDPADVSFVELHWCRMFKNGTTIQDDSWVNKITNVFFTKTVNVNGVAQYQFNDWYTQKTNFLQNGDANSSKNYVDYLINNILNTVALAGSDGFVFKCENLQMAITPLKTKTGLTYLKRTCNMVPLNNGETSFAVFGDENTAAGDSFSYVEYYMLPSNKIVKLYIDGQHDGAGSYLIRCFAEVS